METKTIMAIIAIVFAVGISSIVTALPLISQADANSQDRASGKYGSCNQGKNGYDQWTTGLSGKERAEDRKAFCEFAKP